MKVDSDVITEHMKDADFNRLIDKIEVNDDGCWLFTSAVNPNGYGYFSIKGRYYLAHRVVYEWRVGPIPQGKQIDHLCRVRRCVNPDHLEPVTCKENTHRGDGPAGRNARKTHCKRGHPFNEANTHLRLAGGRSCRACRREVVAPAANA